MGNLQLNTVVTVIGGGLTAVIGLLYWVAAARMFPPDQVGLASAYITSALMVSIAAYLSVGPVFDRFLPTAGSHAITFIARGAALVAVFAAGGALLIGLFAIDADFFHGSYWIFSYVGFTVLLALMALQDHVATGLGLARWGAIKNAMHAVLKLLLLAVLAVSSNSAMAIVAAWAVPAILVTLYLAFLLYRRARSSAGADPAGHTSFNVLFKYAGSAYIIAVITAALPFALPLIVAVILGAETNAYFTLAWSIVVAVMVALMTMSGPFVVEVIANPQHSIVLKKRFLELMLLIALASSVFLMIGGPVVLNFAGEHYQEYGTPILYVSALLVPFYALEVVYTALCRIQARLRMPLLLHLGLACSVLLSSFLLLPDFGAVVIPVTYLVYYSVAALIIIVPTAVKLKQIHELVPSRS